MIELARKNRPSIRLGWMTLTRCLYGSKNLGISEDATIGDGNPIDKS